jgi:flagellar biosynthetic protein FlhB
VAENKDGQEKTESATPKRLDDARDKGQVAKSTDITTASIILLGGLGIYIFAENIFNRSKDFMTTVLLNITQIEITDTNAVKIIYNMFELTATLVFPIIIIIFIASIFGEVSQIGFKIATKKFTEGLRWKQIFNPFSQLKKIFFSANSIFELTKNFFKLFLLGMVIYSVVADKEVELISLVERPFSDLVSFMASLSIEIVFKTGVVYIIIALSDHYYQKWKFGEDMKMTKNELKDENKQMEGDQFVKSRMRALMRSQLRQTMMKNVPEADVIITNPTHYAVALRYKQGQDNAPIVIAKGLDFLAQKIKEIGKENNIPIVENPPLARAIYADCEVEQEVPEALFKAVAEVLAYVYSLSR